MRLNEIPLVGKALTVSYYYTISGIVTRKKSLESLPFPFQGQRALT